MGFKVVGVDLVTLGSLVVKCLGDPGQEWAGGLAWEEVMGCRKGSGRGHLGPGNAAAAG